MVESLLLTLCLISSLAPKIIVHLPANCFPRSKTAYTNKVKPLTHPRGFSWTPPPQKSIRPTSFSVISAGAPLSVSPGGRHSSAACGGRVPAQADATQPWPHLEDAGSETGPRLGPPPRPAPRCSPPPRPSPSCPRGDSATRPRGRCPIWPSPRTARCGSGSGRHRCPTTLSPTSRLPRPGIGSGSEDGGGPAGCSSLRGPPPPPFLGSPSPPRSQRPVPVQ